VFNGKDSKPPGNQSFWVPGILLGATVECQEHQREEVQVA